MDDIWGTSPEIARILKISRSTVHKVAQENRGRVDKTDKCHWKYNLADVREALSRGAINQYNSRFVNPTALKPFLDSWDFPWDEFIVGADLHVPFVRDKIFEQMLRLAEKLKIKNFVHAGDFFDQATFSSFDTYAEDLVDWADEIECAARVHKELSHTFDEVKYFMGSHDLRFWRMLNRAGKASQFNSTFKQAKIPEEDTSRYRFCDINSEWHLTHPRNVIKLNSIPAVRLGAKVRRSIVIGHGHWWGIYKDPSGTHYQIAPGCLTDQNLHGYASLWDTSHDRWTAGFLAVVEKDKPLLFCEESPWGIYLGKK